jgi:hypothetical protein
VAAGLTLDEIRDVVDGASRPELGGAAYRWCVEKHVYGAPLFWNERERRVSGCVAFFVRDVPLNRDRLEKERERRERERRVVSVGETPWETPSTPLVAMTPEQCSRTFGIRLALAQKAHAAGRCDWCGTQATPEEPGQPAGGDVTGTSLPELASKVAGR